MKNFQKYQTHICAHKSVDQLFVESLPSSPNIRPSSATINSPPVKSPSLSTSDRTLKNTNPVHFVPRQRLFLMYIEDKEVKIFKLFLIAECKKRK